MQEQVITKGINFNSFKIENYQGILTAEAQIFLLELHARFNQRRLSLLAEREVEQAYFDAGNYPSFPKETKEIRESDWVCAPLPEDLLDRRVEITGPVERKMVINALNSGSKTFMADFEDSCSPTWSNIIHGQINLRDAINKDIEFIRESDQKRYALNQQTATLIVRPRGWHLNEKHVLVNEEEVSGGLFDFAIFLANNHEALSQNSSGPQSAVKILYHR